MKGLCHSWPRRVSRSPQPGFPSALVSAGTVGNGFWHRSKIHCALLLSFKKWKTYEIPAALGKVGAIRWYVHYLPAKGVQICYVYIYLFVYYIYHIFLFISICIQSFGPMLPCESLPQCSQCCLSDVAHPGHGMVLGQSLGNSIFWINDPFIN